jgi:hypothetical protein
MPQAIKRAVRAAQAAVEEIDSTIEQIEQGIREQQQRIGVLRQERERWATVASEDLIDSPETAAERASAGPAAIAAVTAYLREIGRAYQSDITEATGLNSGTVTHVLRVLGARHLIVATGNKRRNSAEFEWTDNSREPVTA